jgi:hypothetical protein
LCLAAAGRGAEPTAWTVGTAEQERLAAAVPTGANREAVAVRLRRPPKLDGVLKEWDAAPLHVTYLLSAVRTNRSATLRFAYDDQAFYVAGEVTGQAPQAADRIRVGLLAGPQSVTNIRLLDAAGVRPRADGRGPSTGSGQGYSFEAAIPWAGWNGRPGAAGARLAWEITWSDRSGKLAALRCQDGLTRRVAGGEDALAQPALWAPLRWAEPAEGARDALPVVRYKLKANAYVSIVIDGPDGRRVRNLVAEAPRLAGTREEVWDGRDDDGKVMPPAEYRWRGVYHAGLRPVYRMSFNNPGQPPYVTDQASSWGADHDAPRQVACGGDRMFLGWNNCEAGSSLIATDFNGRKQWGFRATLLAGWDLWGIAASTQYVYLAKSGSGWGRNNQHGAHLVRFDAATGRAADWPKEDGGIGEGVLTVRDWAPEEPGRPARLSGLALLDGVLCLSLARENAIERRDAISGRVLGVLPLDAPGALCAGGPGRLYAVSGRRVVALDVASGAVTPLAELGEPRGLAAAGGEVAVADWASNQIVVLDAAGKERRRIGRAGGRQTLGAWQPDGLLHPEGLAYDPQGRLWVAEHDWWPKRISVWGNDGAFAQEFIGPTPYGSMTTFLDELDHTVGYSSGARFRLDYALRTYRVTAALPRDDRPGAFFWMAQEAGQFRTVNGRRYWIADGGAYGKKTVYRVEGDRFLACAALASVRELRQSPAFSNLAAVAAAKDLDAVSWCDRNGDALAQPEELQVRPWRGTWYFGAYWGAFPADDLTQYWPGGSRLWKFPVSEWTAGGAPFYDLDKVVDFAPLRGEVGFVGVDRDGRVLIRGKPIMAYRPDGSVDWTYPSEFAMHGQAGPPAPGRVVAAHRIPGLADLPRRADGQIFCMNGDNGEWYFFTTDGVFVQHIFNDIRVGGHPGPEYVISQEAFGGHFVRTADDGRYYVVSGHTDARVFELEGVDTIRRFEPTQLRFSAAQQAASLARAGAAAYAAKTERMARIPRALDADAQGWPVAWPTDAATAWTAMNGCGVAVDKAWSDRLLFLRYTVQDPSPLVNGGGPAALLFQKGDSVDLQVGADPGADAARGAPVMGDCRLLMTEAGTNRIAVLYQPVVPGTTNPVGFASPWRSVSIDRVTQPTDVVLRTRREPGRYVLEAAVPWAALGIRPRAGLKLRGDFGVLFGNPEGQITLLRSYWSNPNTGVVSDVPTEVTLEPRQWGEWGLE